MSVIEKTLEKVGVPSREKRRKLEETLRRAKEVNFVAEEKIKKMAATLNGEDEWFLRLQRCLKQCATECIDEREGTKEDRQIGSGNSVD